MSIRIATERGRADALVALERAAQAYADAGKTLPTDPSVLEVVRAYSPHHDYAEGTDDQLAYSVAWWDAVFTDAMTRLAMNSLGPLLERMTEAEREHVVAASAECQKHGILGMADDERGARQMMLEHLRSHHPRRAHHAIALLTEELNQ